VREMALVAAMFAIGGGACDGGVLHGMGWAYRCCKWDLSSCSVYRLVFSIVGSRCVGFSLQEVCSGFLYVPLAFSIVW